MAVSAAPQLWWRHAVRCVLAERRALLGAAVRPAPQAPQAPLASPEFALATPGEARERRPGARLRKPGKTLPGKPFWPGQGAACARLWRHAQPHPEAGVGGGQRRRRRSGGGGDGGGRRKHAGGCALALARLGACGA